MCHNGVCGSLKLRHINIYVIFMKKLVILIVAILSITSSQLSAQNVAVKTNFFYWATATPNIGAEVSIDRKNTAQMFFGLNPWKQSGGDQSSLRHWSLMPEFRHWFCQSFNGWFVGAHLMGGEFNVSGVDIPFGLLSTQKNHRYEGWFVGGGVSGGYQWPLSRHWNLETSLGLGYDFIKYDKYKCGTCGRKLKSSHTNYFGPTKAALSLIYVL